MEKAFWKAPWIYDDIFISLWYFFLSPPTAPYTQSSLSVSLLNLWAKVLRECISQEERSWGRCWLCCLHQLHLGKLASGLVFLLRQFTCHLRSFCKGRWILLLSHCSSETIWGRKVLEFLNLSHLSRFSDSSYSVFFVRILVSVLGREWTSTALALSFLLLLSYIPCAPLPAAFLLLFQVHRWN